MWSRDTGFNSQLLKGESHLGVRQRAQVMGTGVISISGLLGWLQTSSDASSLSNSPTKGTIVLSVDMFLFMG